MTTKTLLNRPFQWLRGKGTEDEGPIEGRGSQNPLIMIAKFIAAPFIGLLYFLVLPVAVIVVALTVIINGLTHLAKNAVSVGTEPADPYVTHKR